MDISTIQGRMMVGRFESVEQVIRKDGTLVEGMWRLTLRVEARSRARRLTPVFFDTDQGGEETPIRRQMDAAPPMEGDLLAVRIASRATGKGYVDDIAIGFSVLTGAV